ncbi:hypothetical protein E2C01_032829 [Portunus trituberculatus]|uniref:Uncharacterized protein n=1 Tax=Portunus trituberculatus TaxID=210409 RepID=A0A5B7F1E2_PORTR|nr:hypothetical protein [Portunus trituberculatus]
MVVVVSRFASAHRHQLLHHSQECVPLSPWADVGSQIQLSLNPCSSFHVALPLRTTVSFPSLSPSARKDKNPRHPSPPSSVIKYMTELPTLANSICVLYLADGHSTFVVWDPTERTGGRASLAVDRGRVKGVERV